jgi:cobalamin biosynthesis protein CbiG
MTAERGFDLKENTPPPVPSPVAVYALTDEGARLACRLGEALPGDLYLQRDKAPHLPAFRFTSLAETLQATFADYRAHIFVAAAGIAVRTIAPLLQGKDRDPAVVVLDQSGQFAISLLSGHLGGANELARRIGSLIGACPVITTATDSAGLTAVDELARLKGFSLANLRAVRAINGALLEERMIRVFDPEDRLGWSGAVPEGYRVRFVSRLQDLPRKEPGLAVSWRAEAPADEACHLLLRPRCLVVGLGCHPGAAASEILELIASAFAEHGLSQASIACLTSTSRRQNEPGLAQAAKALQAPFICVEHDALCSVQVPNPSPHVKQHLGVDGICEASAMIQAGQGELLVAKTKGKNVTLAVALAK